MDTENLRRAIKNFKFNSNPSSAVDSSPATTGDMRKLINNIAKLMNTFIQELED